MLKYEIVTPFWSEMFAVNYGSAIVEFGGKLHRLHGAHFWQILSIADAEGWIMEQVF